MGSNMFLTYIIWRNPVEVGPDQGDAFQIHHSSPSNKTILHGLAQKKKSSNLRDESLQGVIVEFAREHDSLQGIDMTFCKMTICNMTICKRLWYSL